MQQPDLRSKEGARQYLAPKNLALHPDAMSAVELLNSSFDALLTNIWDAVPDGPGKTVAIRALHSAQMEFNSTIANGGM